MRGLLLGDSVTFGWGVPVEATFGRQLEVMLSSETGLRVETINSGVGSYNTVQQYNFLKKYIDDLQPDVVILLYSANDIDIQRTPFNPTARRSMQGKSPPEVINLLVKKSWLYRLGSFVSQYSFPPMPKPFDNNARGAKESMDALSSIATISREREVSLAIFFYGGKGDAKSEFSSALYAEIQSLGEKYEVPVGDTRAWWGDVEMRSVTNSIVDSHPNERGHEMLAQGMAEFLTQRAIVYACPLPGGC